MKKLKDLELQKREEMYQSITALGIPVQEAKGVLDYMEDQGILEITAPAEEEAPLQKARIQMTYSGRCKGKSYKPGNIIINIKNAVVDVPAVITSSAASLMALSSSEPIVGILTIITTLLTAVGLCKIELADEAAFILAVLWESRLPYGQTLEEKAGFHLINEKLKLYKRNMLSEIQYNDYLKDLQEIGSIALESGKVVLKETVHILY